MSMAHALDESKVDGGQIVEVNHFDMISGEPWHLVAEMIYVSSHLLVAQEAFRARRCNDDRMDEFDRTLAAARTLLHEEHQRYAADIRKWAESFAI